MKKTVVLFCLIYFTLIFQAQNSFAADNHMYEERITSYARVGGETFRWEMTREFIISDWEIGIQNNSGSIDKIINVEILADSQRGQLEILQQPFYRANFDLDGKYHSNGELLEFSWSLYYFRDVLRDDIETGNTLESEIKSEIFKADGDQYDVESTVNFFTANIQYYEYHNITKDFTPIKVNTELSTKNYESGRVEKTAIHIIKRNADSTIIFEYDHEIQEKSVFQRYLNYLDQPYLWVPFRILGAFVLVYIYIRIHRVIKKRGIKIIQTHGKEMVLVDPEPVTETEIGKDNLES